MRPSRDPGGVPAAHPEPQGQTSYHKKPAQSLPTEDTEAWRWQARLQATL